MSVRRSSRNTPKFSFKTADAQDMTFFEDNYFDFVLFSWCGIDYVDHEGRQKILGEIRRIIKKGGYFYFQSHNLNYLIRKCSICLSKNPSKLAWDISRLLRLRLLNGRKVWKIIRTPLRKQQHLLYNDNTYGFKLKTYFITPVEQIEQLSNFGFACIRVLSLWTGGQIKDSANTKDAWLYFLSKAI